MGKFVDLTGQKFGRLTVIERAENKGKQTCWLCKCECGNEKTAQGNHLKNGRITSCGCLRSEQMKQLNEEKWQDEEYRKMKSEKMKEKMKEKWQDEEYRKMKSEKMKEKWQDEDFKKMQREKTKKQWENEDYRKMQSNIKHNYKGGITTISNYLKNSNSKWFEDCKQKANYTCQLTGKHGCKLNTHHLKAFSTIVIEAHSLYNIQIKPQVKDYTQEELKLLEEYVGSWHKDNSNAVVLSEDVHKLFHKLYGQGENTPEQFEEFRERYMAGEFKEILK